MENVKFFLRRKNSHYYLSKHDILVEFILVEDDSPEILIRNAWLLSFEHGDMFNEFFQEHKSLYDEGEEFETVKVEMKMISTNHFFNRGTDIYNSRYGNNIAP